MAVIVTSYALEALVLLITVAVILYKFSIKNFDYWEKRGIPYRKPLPFLGNFAPVFTFREPIGQFLAQLYNEFKTPYFGMFILNQPYLVLRCPQLIKSVLVRDFNYFYDRTTVSDEKCDSLVSKMMFVVKNPEWKVMRAKMTPVFTSGKIKGMMGLINESAQEMTSYFSQNTDKHSIEAKEVCTKFTTNVIASCAFGINANCFQYEKAQFREVGRMMFDNGWKNSWRQSVQFLAPGIVRLFRIAFFDPRATQFMREVFWNAIEEREKTKDKRNDLIDIILQIKNQSSPLDEIKFEGDRVVAQAGQFFGAGFETTSATLSFTLYEVCINPEIQRKLRQDIKAALSEHGGFTYEAVQNMKYLHMVVCETLRKYPVLPFLDRTCMADYKIPDSGFVVEKGTPVFIPVFGLHYDPEYFPDPETFDPERFSDENKGSLPPFTYIPFGDGPRNCIGERFGLLVTKLGVAHILAEYELEANAATPIPVEFSMTILPASTVGLPMKFKKIVSEAA